MAIAYIFSRMVLLVAPSRLALPPVAVPVPYRKLILKGRRSATENQVQAALKAGGVDLILSVGFAFAADRRLSMGDLLLAPRVFGGADVYLDLPPLQAPGAVRGSLLTLVDEGLPPALHRGQRRLPPVYAFDDHAFWLARAAQAANVPCLVLRATLLESSENRERDPLLPDLLAGRLARAALREPRRWREIAQLPRSIRHCRAQLASALAVLLVLHGMAEK
ncbi:MAG TPA: hypothetical protein VMW62_11385 [Chloroflexota bacterium]|nr:hypothetical protein [Chloroflexota bacterium]